jgi:negative regulator of flagellin synthesis FlgM
MMGKLNVDKASPAGTRPVDAQRTNGPQVPVVDVRPPVQGTDRVEISTRAADMEGLVDKVRSMPEVRQDKVDDVRERLTSGKFNPSDTDIADAIINEETN